MLVDVTKCDASTTVFGHELALPVMLAPAGGSGVVHRDRELAVARAAGRAGTVFCVPVLSSASLLEVAHVATGPLWFQIILWDDKDAVLRLVRRARGAGYHALVVTADAPVRGNHERDVRNGATFPPRITVRNVFDGVRHPRWPYRYWPERSERKLWRPVAISCATHKPRLNGRRTSPTNYAGRIH